MNLNQFWRKHVSSGYLEVKSRLIKSSNGRSVRKIDNRLLAFGQHKMR